MNRLSLRNNRLKFKTLGNSPITLEESIEYTSNEWKQIQKMLNVPGWTWERQDLDWLCSNSPRTLVATLESHPKAVLLTRYAKMCIRPNTSSNISWNILYSLSCRNPHMWFFGLLGLHLLVSSEPEGSPPVWPMRDLRMQWERAFSLVCEVALR